MALYGIILNNFFKKDYMNKKIVHLFTSKLPIISVVLLALTYLYLSIPDNYILQIGGVPVANTYKLPSNIPWKYKYRWLLILIPILILIHLIYSIYICNQVKNLDMPWSMGNDFFSEFQIQVKAVADWPAKIVADPKDPRSYSYKKIPDAKEAVTKYSPDIGKLFNMIQQCQSPYGQFYAQSQYFCNVYRPCGCCDQPAYKKFFPKNKCK